MHPWWPFLERRLCKWGRRVAGLSGESATPNRERSRHDVDGCFGVAAPKKASDTLAPLYFGHQSGFASYSGVSLYTSPTLGIGRTPAYGYVRTVSQAIRL